MQICWCWLASLALASTAAAQGDMQFVLPQEADGATTAGDGHLVVTPRGVRLRAPLVLVLPGTAPSIPMAYRLLSRTIAGWGTPVVALNYSNAVPNAVCAGATNLACYEDLLTEVVTGEDRSAFTAVSRANSVEFRLLRLLQFLHRMAPERGWNQFFAGEQILWHRLVVSGHSQGGSVAAFIAKRVRTARAVLFASWDYNQRQQRVAPWMERPGATPAAAFFALGNEQDEVVNYRLLTERVWPALGITAFGDPAPIESAGFNTVRTARMNIVVNGVAHLLVANDNVSLLNPSDRQSIERAWRHLYQGAAAIAVNAASLESGIAAPSSIVSVFAAGVQAGRTYSLRVEGREAHVIAAAENQVNAVLPPDLPLGPVYLELREGSWVWTGILEIQPAAPGVFTRNSSGEGEVAATWTANVLTIFGTGWRGGSDVRATLDGVALEVLYAGVQPEFDGLDQMNLRVPGSLSGKAGLDLQIEVSAARAKTVKVSVPELEPQPAKP